MTQGSSKIPAQSLHTLIEELTTTEKDVSKTLVPDGENGVVWAEIGTFTNDVKVLGDNKGFYVYRTDGTLAGAFISDTQDQYGALLGGADGEGNLTNLGLVGSNLYIGTGNQYIGNNSALPHGYLKLSGEPVTDENGNEFYPLSFQQIESEQYKEEFTDSVSHDLSSGLVIDVLTTTPLLNNYQDPSDFEYSFRLEETGNRSTEIEYWFEVGAYVSVKYKVTVSASTIVTVNGAGQLLVDRSVGDILILKVQALNTGQGRGTYVRGDDADTKLILRQLGYSASWGAMKGQITDNLALTDELDTRPVLRWSYLEELSTTDSFSADVPKLFNLQGGGAGTQEFNIESGKGNFVLADNWFDLSALGSGSTLTVRGEIEGQTGDCEVSLWIKLIPDKSNPTLNTLDRFTTNTKVKSGFQYNTPFSGFVGGIEAIQIGALSDKNETLTLKDVFLEINDV